MGEPGGILPRTQPGPKINHPEKLETSKTDKPGDNGKRGVNKTDPRTRRKRSPGPHRHNSNKILEAHPMTKDVHVIRLIPGPVKRTGFSWLEYQDMLREALNSGKVVFTPQEFIKQVKASNPGEVIVWDDTPYSFRKQPKTPGFYFNRFWELIEEEIY
jgi:hypothetical protein